MTTTDPTAGPQIVSGDYDEAAAHHDAMLREIESLRVQLAEAREMAAVDAEIIDDLRAVLALSPGQSLTKAVTQLRDDLAQLRSQLAEARAEIARLEHAAHEQGADLWIAEDRLDWLRKRVRLAMDLLDSPTVPHEKGPDVPSAYGILSHALAATEGSPTVPQADEEAAALAEIDRLRTEVKRLSARVREWEAVNADLAARCDSGDIPIRLGERYSVAVLREIDRLRTERDRLLEELPEDNTIAAAVRGLRAARSATPDTGSTT